MKVRNVFLSLSLAAVSSALGCDWDKKSGKSSYTLEMMCKKCDKYVLTLSGHELKKDVFLWEAIVNPARFKASSDVSQFLPVSALPAIKCDSCKELCFKPILDKSESVSKAAYKIAAARIKFEKQ